MMTAPRPESLLAHAFARLDKTSLGIACGTVLGLGLFASTWILLWKDGEVVGPHLALLSQIFMGYSVTPAGSFAGLGYGAALGFVLGWLTAFLHNGVLTTYLFLVRFKANLSSITDYIDP
jgi:hypothetical protein